MGGLLNTETRLSATRELSFALAWVAFAGGHVLDSGVRPMTLAAGLLTLGLCAGAADASRRAAYPDMAAHLAAGAGWLLIYGGKLRLLGVMLLVCGGGYLLGATLRTTSSQLPKNA